MDQRKFFEQASSVPKKAVSTLKPVAAAIVTSGEATSSKPKWENAALPRPQSRR